MMTDFLEIRPSGAVRGSIRPPGSKSITNRALVCAALARGESTLTGVLDCDDTRVMIDGLRQLGLVIEHEPGRQAIRMVGCGGRPPAAGAELMVGNSGTTVRFLTALVTLGHGRFRLDGTPRMRERPIQDLLHALEQLGAAAVSALGSGCPPVVVQAAGLPGGRATVAGNLSSQFLSALLMAAPCAEHPVELIVQGRLVSQPYVEMTLRVMEAFGIAVQPSADGRFRIPAPSAYRGARYEIEPDASAASYFFALAAITGGRVTVEGLSRDSIQGDVAFCECLARMGCTVQYGPDQITVAGGPLRGIEADMNAISDTVQTLAAVALFAQGPTAIRGVAHIRHKETDRIGALAAELRKLGADVHERSDGLEITAGPLHGARLQTYDDHRMAMSLALVGLRVPGVIICDPGCTAKTYPRFFEDLGRLTAG
ncbi:MAG: 3-phosphoshikimate 1-carboxyvinyltransferase [Thermoguttaceae bacterium]|jgi:3-phosphoshikimate 1-carboxyvinyltransferase